MIVVGVTGYARSGKDTFAQELVDYAVFTRHAFADELKKDVAQFLGLTLSELESRKDELRWLLQWYGTEWSRKEKGDIYWIDRLEQWVRAHRPARLVVPDVRFPNEAVWVRSHGGKIIRVIRRGQYPTSEHASERMVDEIRCFFRAEAEDGDIEALKHRARHWADIEGYIS